MIRLRCNASSTADNIYVDHVALVDCSGASNGAFSSEENAESRELISQKETDFHIETAVFPNPTTEQLSISGLNTISSVKTTQIFVVNALGQTVLNKIVDKD